MNKFYIVYNNQSTASSNYNNEIDLQRILNNFSSTLKMVINLFKMSLVQSLQIA